MHENGMSYNSTGCVLDNVMKLNEICVRSILSVVPLKCCLTTDTGITHEALLLVKRDEVD